MFTLNCQMTNYFQWSVNGGLKYMIISIVNQKGGCGKTSMSVMAAIALAEVGRVLCIDTDPQGGLTSFLAGNRDLKSGTYDLIIGKAPEVIEIDRHGVKVDLIGADYRLDMIYTTIDHFAIKRALKLIEKDYDFIIFDTPPTVQGITKACAICADRVVTPADISLSTIKPTLYTIQVLSEMDKQANVYLIGKDPKDKHGYVSDLTRDFVEQLGTSFCGYIDKSATSQKIVAGVSQMNKKIKEQLAGLVYEKRIS